MSQPTTRCDVSPPVPPTGHFDLTRGETHAPERVATLVRGVEVAARKWCQDRALPPATETTVACLLRDAVTCTARVRPRGLTLTIRWVDLDHVRLELVWLDCKAGASTVGEQAERSAPAFDELADGWGIAAVGATDAWQWFDVDTRRASLRQLPGHD